MMETIEKYVSTLPKVIDIITILGIISLSPKLISPVGGTAVAPTTVAPGL
jgi:hypothetical protein